ncbi:MAG: heavy-metal-associated domain-containing protein [Patescibacteria group bacterium]
MQKTKFKIQGIKCSNCSLLIEERLKNLDGVVKVKVDHDSSKGVVIYDEQKITERDIYQAIESINDFHLEKIEEIIPSAEEMSEAENKEQDLGIKKTKFRIKGLKCDNCVLLIESRLKSKEGVVKVKVDQTSNKGVVIYDKQKIDESDIYKTIEEIGGFKVEKIEDAVKNTDENTNYDNPSVSIEVRPPIESSNKRGFAIVATIVLLIFLFATFGQKNNQGSQINGSVKNTQVQVQQQADNQQAPATKTLEKSDNPVLEAYVVSRCPFGIQMQRIMADVVKNIPSLANNVKVRYMGAVSNGTISSMHGSAEAQENLRQICLREEQPNKYWSYVSCQMKSGDTTGCETTAGVDASKLNVCVSDSSRGLVYAQKDFDLNSKYQVQGSPTLILNGQQVSEFNFGGRTSDAVKSVICSGFNNQPGSCSTKLTTANAATSFSATY